MVNPYRGGRSNLPPPGLQADEKKKLWIYGILFVVVLGAFLASLLYQNVGGEKSEEAPTPDFPIDVAPERRGEGGEALPEYVPQSMAELRDAAEETLREGLGALRETGDLVDGAGPDSTPLLDYLLDEAVGDVQVNRISELYYRLLPEKEVLFEPAGYRGRFTSAFGKIVEVPEPVPYAGKVKEVREVHPVVFRTADGSLYRALSQTPVEKEPGEWIQVYGIFYRVRDVTVSGEPEKAFSLLLTKPIEEAFPPVTVTEIDPEWGKVIGERDLEASQNYERPFWLILNYVKNLGIEGWREKKAAGEVAIEDMANEAKPLARDPDFYRFSAVSARGRIIDPYRDYLDKDNPGKIDMVTTAVLVQPSGYMIRLAAPRVWDEYGFTMGEDFVRVEGIFYKRWQYIPRQGGPAREIPLVIVTDIVPLSKEESGLLPILQVVCIVLAVGILFAFVAFAFRDRKARAAFRERLEEQKRGRVAKRSGRGAEPPADGPRE